MADSAPAAETPTPDSGPAKPAESIFDSLHAVLRELPGLVSDRVDLFSLELSRAGLALAQIVVLIVGAAILGVTAWLMLWAGIVVALVGLGLHWALALLAALLVNAAAVWIAVLRVQRLLPSLRLPATRRHLTLGGGRIEPQPAANSPVHERPAAS